MKRKNIFITISSVLFFTGSYCFADNGESMIQLRIYNETTGYLDTPAEILIIDSQGRRTGYSPDAPFDGDNQLNKLEEIPLAMYIRQGMDSPSDEDPAVIDDRGGAYYRVLTIQEATQGKYSLQIIGRITGEYSLEGSFQKTDDSLQYLDNSHGFIIQGQTITVNIDYSPIPGIPAPVITKIVTFDALRQDLTVAQKMNQLGDDKFAKSLIKNSDLAEKLSGVCDRRNTRKERCEPAIAALKLLIQRLAVANRKCDSKDAKACDEDKDLNDFGKEHRKDHDYDEFFKDWDKDGWHKDKKTCKRFVSDEALRIISEDAQWLIKSLGAKQESGKAEGKH